MERVSGLLLLQRRLPIVQKFTFLESEKKRDFLKKNDDIDEDALAGGKTELEPVSALHNDNRSKWAANIVSTKTIKVLSKEFAANKKFKPQEYTTDAYDKNEPKNSISNATTYLCAIGVALRYGAMERKSCTAEIVPDIDKRRLMLMVSLFAYNGCIDYRNADQLNMESAEVIQLHKGSKKMFNMLNRYNDIICIDSTRVVLKDRSPDDDYIHASWMTMPDQYRFICTQGPLEETLADFWHMMFCERSTVLVQLCNFVEGKHEKCRQYFPKSKGSTESYGSYKVTFKETKPDPYDSVKHTVLEVDSKGRSMTVNHFAYLVWPDHTAPFSPAPMVGCLRLCRQLASDKPITVHCSAGIGRSATFVAIEYAWQRIKENGDLQMIELLKELRHQRFHAIQSPIQYIFLHMCVLELAAEDNLLPRKKYQPYLESYVAMLKKYNKKVAAAEARADAKE